MNTPVFSAAHSRRWDNLEDQHLHKHPKRKRIRFSEDSPGEETDAHVASHSRFPTLGLAAPFASPFPSQLLQSTDCGVVADAKMHVTEEDALPAVMAVKTHSWISLWFILTAPVIAWDVGYCLMRPRSMVGGDLHWIWEPYGLYQEIDYIYGIKALQDNNGFTNAQAFMNILETLLNLAYVYLAHVSGWTAAPLLGFTAATMTLWKTILYWLQEFYCGGCSVGHNTVKDLIVYWIIPNGFWIVVPALIMVQLGADISDSLRAEQRASSKIASGKQS